MQERQNLLTCQDESCATFCPAFIIRCVVSLTVWAFTLILKSYHLMVGKSSVSGGDYWRWKNLFHKSPGLLINPSVFIPPLLPTPAVTGKCWITAFAGIFFLSPQFWCLLHNAQRRKLNVSIWVPSLMTLTIIAERIGDRAEVVLGEKKILLSPREILVVELLSIICIGRHFLIDQVCKLKFKRSIYIISLLPAVERNWRLPGKKDYELNRS